MKLIIQIAIGVFLGTLASQFTIDTWHNYQENAAISAATKQQDKLTKARLEQGERIRAMILQSRQGNSPQAGKAPTDFIPDDAQTVIPKQK